MARGPAYPFISLDSAVSMAQKIYDYAKKSQVSSNAVLKEKLGYSPTSSSAVKVVAALKYYGLIDVTGNGEKEALRISDRAYRILLDSSESQDRKKALRDACLAPKAHKLCWDLWGAELPQSMRASLLFEHGFIDTTVDGFLKNYKASLQFAGLLDEKNGLENTLEEESEQVSEESGAPLQSQDGAIPLGASQPATRAQLSTPNQRPIGLERPISSKESGMRQEIFTVAEGDVVIHWPERLSAESLEDFKDWLRILERKITRSSLPPNNATGEAKDQSSQP